MAAKIPDRLKSADIQRFATRASQLEKFRPIVTYWTEYYILQQILNRGLHTADDECTEYATTLMDKLERVKTENASNDAIADDVAAKAYMENFAMETFERADKAQRENSVNKSTADTFQAAATFLDTLGIWGPLDVEQAAKSKFAKFHALRIVKALKAGENPNDTNPKMEPPPALSEDVIDAEMQDLEAPERPQQDSGYMHPSVERGPESVQPSQPGSAAPGEPGSQLQSSPSTPHGPAVVAISPGDVSPVQPPDSVNSRQGSIGGGYFPNIPDDMAPSDSAPTAALLTQPLAPPSQPPFVSSPADFYSGARSSSPAAPTITHSQVSPVFHAQSAGPPAAQIGSYAPTPVGQAPPAAPIPSSMPAPPLGGYRTDDESTMEAQKHAKWAISALNFEDVPTAVKELRIALQALGAA